MDSFAQSLQNWQFFFIAMASASATLTGLLFVSLSLNRDRLKGENANITLSIARNTFGDFLYVLMIGLVFLVPHLVPISLTVALLVLGIASGLGVVIRKARQLISSENRVLETRLILRRIGLPSIASLELIVVAIDIALNHYGAIYGLVGIIAA